MIFYVNGYGVPRDVLADGNYSRYLSACRDAIRRYEEEYLLIDRASAPGCSVPPAVVYLAGGATNPGLPGKTEADAMRRWFVISRSCGLDLRLIDRTLDLRGNLEALRREIGPDEPVMVFCEWARQDYARFLARRMFRCAVVYPIRFDGGVRFYPLARLRQLAKLPLRVAAWHSPAVRRYVEYPLRLRFIRRQGGTPPEP